MKITAGRQRDIADARALVQHMGLSRSRQVFDILQKYIPSQYLTAKIQYIVNDLLT
jgi:hypothetical protein